MELQPDKKPPWTIDRRIPIGIIITMIIQTISVLYMATYWVINTNSRLDAIEMFMKENSGVNLRVHIIEERLRGLERKP